jgi:UDP-N-acetylglucosamine 1-carboxyvinyltransferase
VRVYKAEKLEGISIQTNIFPGFPTDLQSPFSVLMTQAEGMSKIHEVLFESRLNFLVELEKMKAKLALLNPHEALIFGDSSLKGTQVTSWDLRAGAAMVIA